MKIRELKRRKGWVLKLLVSCDLKESGQNKSYFTSLNSENGQFEVNLSLVYGLRCLGKSHAAGESFSAIMDVPLPCQIFSNIVHNAVCEVAEYNVKRASSEYKIINDGDGDVAVTVDGTWMRRGHVSKFGAASIISVDNGKVLDTEVCSK